VLGLWGARAALLYLPIIIETEAGLLPLETARVLIYTASRAAAIDQSAVFEARLTAVEVRLAEAPGLDQASLDVGELPMELVHLQFHPLQAARSHLERRH
jgi:hypothetical protein